MKIQIQLDEKQINNSLAAVLTGLNIFEKVDEPDAGEGSERQPADIKPVINISGRKSRSNKTRKGGTKSSGLHSYFWPVVIILVGVLALARTLLKNRQIEAEESMN